MTWLPLLVIPLLIRWIFRASTGESTWDTRRDLAWMLASGLVTALLCATWLARFHLRGYPLTASDFGQYCAAVDLVHAGERDGWPGQRSVAAAWLAGSLARGLGVLDALALAAALSTGAVGAGLYLWGRALHSRLAGASAALFACSVAPLVALSRTVTFYPTLIAGFVWAAAGAAAAARWRTLPAFALAGTTAGLALLLDARGLIFAGPALAVAALAGLRRPLGLVFLAAPVALSWHLGAWAYPPGAVPLENQLVAWAEDALRFAHVAPTGLPAPSTSFVWGQTDLAQLARTLRWMADLQDALRAAIPAGMPSGAVAPWLAPLAVATVVAVLALHRHPWRLLALVGTVAPFAVALRGATQLLGHPRYVANGLVLAPLLFGLAWAAIIVRSGRPAVLPRGRTAAALVALLLLVLGVVPSWLSPVSPWRQPLHADEEPQRALLNQAGRLDLRIDEACDRAFRRARVRGHAATPRLYPSLSPPAPSR